MTLKHVLNMIDTLTNNPDILNIAAHGSHVNEPRDFEDRANEVKSEPVSATRRYTFGTYAKIEDI